MDDNQSALFGLCGENHVVSIFPHLDNQRLTREDMRGESRVHLTDALWVCIRVFLLDSTGAESVRAEAVKNWSLKATHGRHLWVNMQGVPIVAQSIEESLVTIGHFLLDEVWSPVRNLRDLRLDGALVAKSAETAHKKTCSDGRHHLTSGSIDDISIED